MGGFRLRKATTIGAAAWLALVLSLVACGDDDTAAPPVSGARAAVVPSVDENPQAILDARPYAVGERTETLVDSSRGTQAVPAQGIAARPDRTIELTILYPAAGDGKDTKADDQPVHDAPVADGRFPLLVFAHGWTSSGPEWIPTAQRWARAGYVIALPTFPLSKDGIGFSDDRPQQPGDMSFTIDKVLGYADDLKDPLAGHVDPEHIAVGGHSLGSATVFGFLNSCCADPRVDAVIAASGGPLAYPGGEYPHDLPLPLLLVHGARDKTVDHGASDIVFDRYGGDISYLLIAGGEHNSFREGDDHELFDQAVIAFLDAKLGLDPHAMDGLADEIDATGRATFRTKG